MRKRALAEQMALCSALNMPCRVTPIYTHVHTMVDIPNGVVEG